nr:unnamed protein product [Digitaria exilis]
MFFSCWTAACRCRRRLCVWRVHVVAREPNRVLSGRLGALGWTRHKEGGARKAHLLNHLYPLPPPGTVLIPSRLRSAPLLRHPLMYLQYYINEKGDKVYTTKVVRPLRVILAPVLMLVSFFLPLQKESPLGVPTQSAHPGRPHLSALPSTSRQGHAIRMTPSPAALPRCPAAPRESSRSRSRALHAPRCPRCSLGCTPRVHAGFTAHRRRPSLPFTIRRRRHTWVHRFSSSFVRSGFTRYSAAPNRKHLTTTETSWHRIVRQLTDDGYVAQVLVPGNVLEHLEALCHRQIDLSQDDVDLTALVQLQRSRSTSCELLASPSQSRILTLLRSTNCCPPPTPAPPPPPPPTRSPSPPPTIPKPANPKHQPLISQHQPKASSSYYSAAAGASDRDAWGRRSRCWICGRLLLRPRGQQHRLVPSPHPESIRPLTPRALRRGHRWLPRVPTLLPAADGVGAGAGGALLGPSRSSPHHYPLLIYSGAAAAAATGDGVGVRPRCGAALEAKDIFLAFFWLSSVSAVGHAATKALACLLSGSRGEAGRGEEEKPASRDGAAAADSGEPAERSRPSGARGDYGGPQLGSVADRAKISSLAPAKTLRFLSTCRQPRFVSLDRVVTWTDRPAARWGPIGGPPGVVWGARHVLALIFSFPVPARRSPCFRLALAFALVEPYYTVAGSTPLASDHDAAAERSVVISADRRGTGGGRGASPPRGCGDSGSRIGHGAVFGSDYRLIRSCVRRRCPRRRSRVHAKALFSHDQTLRRPLEHGTLVAWARGGPVKTRPSLPGQAQPYLPPGQTGLACGLRRRPKPGVGYLKGPSRQTPPRRSSRLKTLERGSKLEGDVHPRAGVSATFEAQQPRSRGTFTLERAFPSRSRLGKLELAAPGTAPETLRPSSPIINDSSAVKKEDSLHHATAHGAEKTSVKSTWRGGF